jgi:MFS family permease
LNDLGTPERIMLAFMRGLRWLARVLRGQVVEFVGGPARARVIALFAGVLALSSAQIATVGAVAPQLEHSLHIGNTKIGLLNSVALLVGAVAVIPVGLLVDRARRIPLLAASIVLWSLATLLAAVAHSYSSLLLTRVGLGVVAATAGPAIASLTGDYFPSRERGRIYGYILSGEIAGTAAGFLISGTVASVFSWRVSFALLALPGLFLARALWRTVPEPQRGGQSRLQPGTQDLASAPADFHRAADAADVHRATDEAAEVHRAADVHRLADEGAGLHRVGDAGHAEQPAGEEYAVDDRELAHDAATRLGFTPDPALVLRSDPNAMSLAAAVRYILSIPTNLLLIVGSSLGYFFFAGLQTFAVVFVRGHYHASQATATLVLGLLVLGALAGTLISGPITDTLVRRGRLQARVWVPALCYLGAAALLIPGLLGSHLYPAVWFDMGGAALICAANPPLDAARLDIMPSRLWGRAESTRTFLRSLGQALAPLLFGAVADLVVGIEPAQAPVGTHTHGIVSSATGTGLQVSFLIMLSTLAAAGLVMLRARYTYPADVATAGAAWTPETSGQPVVAPEDRR